MNSLQVGFSFHAASFIWSEQNAISWQPAILFRQRIIISNIFIKSMEMFKTYFVLKPICTITVIYFFSSSTFIKTEIDSHSFFIPSGMDITINYILLVKDRTLISLKVLDAFQFLRSKDVDNSSSSTDYLNIPNCVLTLISTITIGETWKIFFPFYCKS